MPNTINLPELRKATDKEISELADRLVAGDWLTSLPGDYLTDLISRVPLRKRQRFYDEHARRHPDPTQRRGVVALPPVPDGWDPFASEEWTPAHDSALEVSLRVAEFYDGIFDARASEFARPDARYDKTPGYKPEPRHDWLFLRKEMGLTLEELGRIIDQDKSVVSRWESGHRPCDDRTYFGWLHRAAEEVAAEARLTAFFLVMKRDRWAIDGLTMGDAHEHLWEALFKPGGTMDRWRRTGTLPAFTPSDAGLVAA